VESNGERLPLATSFAIGRLPENNLILDGGGVSRRHALIHSHGNAGFWLMDFGSSNGVAVNHRRVFEPVRLHDKDRIEIAGHVLTFRERRSSLSKNESAPASSSWKTTERASHAFAPTNHGVILFDDAGKITTITPQALEWLKVYFEAPSPAGVLPPKVSAWLVAAAEQSHSRNGSISADVLIVPRENKRLVIQLAEKKQRQKLLLLTEERPVFSIELLQTLGLTPKESEVLHWLAEGKTNPEIGIILNASPRTVGKHIEHIFEKLGVETRTAALLCAMDKLSRPAF
jgi:DNA-binding CsgD family transcriptional regulator/pSer/pThr/pTyr-binding forkhead associated (FHA) protein